MSVPGPGFAPARRLLSTRRRPQEPRERGLRQRRRLLESATPPRALYIAGATSIYHILSLAMVGVSDARGIVKMTLNC